MDRDELINTIARSASLCDCEDLPALASLHDRFEALRDALDDPTLVALAGTAHDAGLLLERIVLREVDDAEAALGDVRRAAAYLQEAYEALCAGRPLPGAFSLGGHESSKPSRDPEIVEAWIQSIEQAIATIEPMLLRVESADVSDEDLGEIAGEVRRRIHTIKGEAGVLSLPEAQATLHDFETQLEASPVLPVERALEIVDWLRECMGVLASDANAELPSGPGGSASERGATSPAPVGDTRESLRAGGAIGASSAGSPSSAERAFDDQPIRFEGVVRDDNLTDFLTESREHIAGAEGALLQLDETPGDGELINTVFRAFHTIKGVAGFLHLDPIVRLAHSAEFLLDAARKGTISLDSAGIDLILRSCDAMSRLIEAIDGGTAPTGGMLASLIGELDDAAAGRGPRAGAGNARAARRVEVGADADAAAPSEAPAGDRARKRQDQTVKVSTSRMDALVNMVGELVIAQQMVVQDPTISAIANQRLQRNLTHAGKIIRDLQEVAMSLRMVTLRGLFQKMARLVRDVSARAGKRVRLDIEGEDTELDRNVVEEISDPLVHMIRNACDHGIEPESERIAAGKNPIGTLALRAFHRGGSIVIQVCDDGRGLNREKILRKAIERGIVPADRDPRDISDEEVFNMVFLPGFSTADKVTDISGRGVGMDVVRRNIEALRGQVEITSRPGQGSTFSMRLPLTMAIIDGMVVRVGGERYVIPTLNIEQSFRPTPEQLHTAGGGRGEMAMVRGSLLAIHRLRTLFGLNEGETDLTRALLVVLEAHGERTCLAVDEILGQQQVVIKSLGRGLGTVRGVSGGAILGDGRVAPILDIGGMLSVASASQN